MDLLILRLYATEILDIVVSRPPFNSTKKHTVEDAKKLLLISVCNLCKIFTHNFNCSIEDAKGVRTYCIQAIGDRLILFTTSLIDKKKYLSIELASSVIENDIDEFFLY
ncbi:16017_t:CDS:2 [Funneliformis geosporum]|nr:16017_t:CDS:2 [Funneliformis geosporum]